MREVYRVDMSTLAVQKTELPEDKAMLGGRGLTSDIVNAEVPPQSHALSADNKLVIAPGILSGTAAPCSGRLSIGARSPLTGTIKESNAGGTAAQKLARLGIAALVIEGQAEKGKCLKLVVTKEGIAIEPADDLAGLGNYDTADKLRAAHGEKVSCISIGQAGEMRLTAASIAVTDMEGRPTRHAGRGGLGAVMGSKGLKAIVIDDAGAESPKLADADAFKAAAKKFASILKEHPVTGETLPTYGTNALANVINEAGDYPTRNFSTGTFEGTDRISGETQRETILARGGKVKHGCHPGCTIRCSRIWVDKEGNYVTKGPEYETIWAHGADCGIDDLDAIAQMDRLDDDIGVDTIEVGAAIGVAMEGGVVPFGDAEGALNLIREIGKGTPLGRIIGSGAGAVGQAYGVVRVPTVKNQALPAYDPRSAQGIGVTYATSTMGADHTAGYAIAMNILGVGGNVDPHKPGGQVEISRNLQIATAALDATGLCLFVAFAVLDKPEALDAICEMITALTGTPFSPDDYAALGKQVLIIERAFNRAAGFTAADDRLPGFFSEEKLAPHGTTFSVPDEELDTVFSFEK